MGFRAFTEHIQTAEELDLIKFDDAQTKPMIKQGMNILEQNEKKRLDYNPELKQINFLDRRVYKRGEGVFYPSVTTILQYMPKNKFFESWMKDVGHNADLIMRRAGKQGTQVHEAAEKLVLGEESLLDG